MFLFFLISPQKYKLWYSLEASWCDDANEYINVNVLKFLTFCSILIWPKYNVLFFMQLFQKIHSGMTNSEDPDQTAPLGAV